MYIQYRSSFFATPQHLPLIAIALLPETSALINPEESPECADFGLQGGQGLGRRPSMSCDVGIS